MPAKINAKSKASVVVTAMLVGLILTLVIFVVGLLLVVSLGESRTIPGVIDYRSDDVTLSVSPSDQIWVVYLVCTALAGAFLAWRSARRRNKPSS